MTTLDMTDKEVEALDQLITASNEGHDLRSYCNELLINEDGTYDETLLGLWHELTKMGYLNSKNAAGGDIIVFDVTPDGYWAADKYKQILTEEKEKERRLYQHDFYVAAFSAALALICGIVGVIIGKFLI